MVDEGCVVVAGDIEMFAPAVDGVAPGVSTGRKAGNDLQAMGSRLEAVDRVVLAAARSVDGLHLGVMEHALLHVESPTRSPDKIVNGVVAIFASEAVQEDGFSVGFSVAIAVLEED